MKSHGKSPWNSPVPLQKVMHLRKVGLQARPPGDVIFGDSDRCETYENENQTVEIMVTMVIIVHVAPSTNSVITVYTIYTRYTIYNTIYTIYTIYILDTFADIWVVLVEHAIVKVPWSNMGIALF